MKPWWMLLSLLLVGCAGRQQPEVSDPATDTPRFSIERRRQAYEFTDQLALVRISNRYGDLRIRATERWQIGVQAVIQRIGQPPREPHFEVKQDERQFALRIRLADDRDSAPVNMREGRVDLVVFVPPSVALEVETADGALQVKRFRGPVRARSRAGSIRVSGFAPLDVSSVSGPIIVRQLDVGFSGESRILSEQGEVEIGIPVVGAYRASLEGGAGLRLNPAWGSRLALAAADINRFDHAQGNGGPHIQVQTGGSVLVSPVEAADP